MSEARVKIPPKLIPVFQGEARYRGAYGGRGSAKTRTFAKMTAVRGYQFAQEGRRGVILAAREHLNSLDESSMEEIKEAIRSEPWLEAFYDIGEKYIRTKCGRVKYVFAGLRHNLDSIKSKSKILLCWVDEAESVREAGWTKLIPTVREDDSEIWVTWNPEEEGSPTDNRFRKNPPTNSKIVEMNWRDNPWFPAVLEQERLNEYERNRDDYLHVWEGGYKEIMEGAIYAEEIRLAMEEERLTSVPVDHSKPIDVFWDLGWADCTSMWFVQTIGKEIRVIDFYQNQLQKIQHYAQILQNKGYIYGKQFLPHDAFNGQLSGKNTDQSLRDLGFKTQEVAKLSIRDGIQAARTLFPSLWFDAGRCSDGLSALKQYRYDVDPDSGKWTKEPKHDHNSHAADAFRYMAVGYAPPRPKEKQRPAQSGGWMSL